MRKYVIGFVYGIIVSFPLGINFGKDAPLFSNPFAAKPDIAAKVIERTGGVIDDTKQAIHKATKPKKERSGSSFSPREEY